MLKKNIVLCGNYGATNLGDELILNEFISALNAQNTYKITVLSTNPAETSSKYGTPSVNLFPCGMRSFFKSLLPVISSGLRRNVGGSREISLLKTIKTIKNAELFILGGGGLFTDEHLKAVFIWYTQVFIAFLFKKKIYICANSIGPLKTKIGKFFTRKALNKASLITVRDSNSFEEAKKLGISEEKIKITADMAFSNTASVKSHYAYPEKSLVPKSGNILLSLRPFLNFTPKLLKVFPDFIKYLAQKENLNVILMPFQVLKDNDYELMQKIHKLSGKNVEISNPTLDFSKIFELFYNAKYVIGMRFHSLILATITKTPFLSISYSSKNSGYLKDINFTEADINPTNLTLDFLIDKFYYLKNNYSQIQDHLGKKFLLQSQKTKLNIEYLKNLL